MKTESSLIMAERLKKLRLERSLSHVSLSKALKEQFGIEISRDSLMNYEVSDPNSTKAYKNEGMRVEFLRCLAEFYGVSTDYILGLTNDRSSERLTVDDLGFSDYAIEKLESYSRFHKDYLSGVDMLLQASDFYSFAAFSFRLRDFIRLERSAGRSWIAQVGDIVEGERQRQLIKCTVREGLEKMIFEKYPEAKGLVGIVLSDELIENRKAEVMRFAEKMICTCTGYSSYMEEVKHRNNFSNRIDTE